MFRAILTNYIIIVFGLYELCICFFYSEDVNFYNILISIFLYIYYIFFNKMTDKLYICFYSVVYVIFSQNFNSYTLRKCIVSYIYYIFLIRAGQANYMSALFGLHELCCICFFIPEISTVMRLHILSSIFLYIIYVLYILEQHGLYT